jgi:hypothetical protein
MTSAILALTLGTLLAVGALAFVLYPLFFPAGERPRAPEGAGQIVNRSAGGAGISETLSVAALREIEFDRATGKLSDADYAVLKERYTRDALAALREQDRQESPPAALPPADHLEAMISAYRARQPSCALCGPRPEEDALFCSNCGRYLPGACQRCGARVDEPDSRFCAACGHRLAA